MSGTKRRSGGSSGLLLSLFALVLVPLLLAGCASERPAPVPTGEGGIYKIGKPYQIAGVWYYPKEDERYDATGIGSWYGPQFHGKRTANGEIFDQEQLTAAHPTLPMPVLVRVTNLENGRSLVVRVNDRGPFVNGREIDLSRKAAELLGYDRKGTARVRVQYVGRAPLPGIPGTNTTQFAGQDTFVAPKPVMDESEKRVEVASRSAPVTAATLAAPPGVKTAPVTTAAPPPAMAPVASNSSMRPITDNAPVANSSPAPLEPDGTVERVSVPAHTSIFVQAGAFRNFSNAETVHQRLLAQGVGHVQVTPVMVEGTQYYRVRIGPIADVPTADASLQNVIQKGHAGARIVVE